MSGNFDSQGRFVAPVDVVDPSTAINNFTTDGRFIQPVMLVDPTTGLPYAPGLSGGGGSLTGPTLIMAGDSQIADGWQAGNGYTFNYRVPMWVRSGLRYRANCDFNLHMFATSGFTTANWIATHMASCVAACNAATAAGSTPVVLMKLGTNDCGAATPIYAQVIANYETIFDALAAAGAIVFPVLVLPRTGSAVLSANGEKLRNGINHYLSGLGYRNDRRIVPINTQSVMCDATGAQNAGFFGDGLHPTSTGAKAEGTYIASVLAAYIPGDIYQPLSSANDVYDATYNPLGSRFTGGLFSGVTGTKANGQVTGNIATGFTAGVFSDGNSLNHTTAGTHLTAVGSVVASGLIANLPMQQFVLGGTAGNGEYLAFYAPNYPQGTGLVPGDLVEMSCYLEWDAGLTNVSALMNVFNLWFQGQAGEGLAGDTTLALPSGAGSMLLTTNPVTIPAGYSNTNIQNNILLIGALSNNNTAVAGTVRIGAPWLRKVG